MHRYFLPFSALLLAFAINCSEKSHEEYFNIGFKARTEQDFAKAKKNYLKALKIKKTAELYKELGNVYLFGEHDLDKAEEHYRLSLNVDPNYMNALHNMGVISLERYANSINKKGKGKERFLEEAEQWFFKAKIAAPNFDLTYTNLGKLYFYKKTYKKALKYFNQAIELNADNPLPYTGLGEVFLQQKKYDQALMNLEKAYDISTNVPETALLLSRVYKKKHDRPKARHYYSVYLKLLKQQKREKEYKKARKERKELNL